MGLGGATAVGPGPDGPGPPALGGFWEMGAPTGVSRGPDKSSWTKAHLYLSVLEYP